MADEMTVEVRCPKCGPVTLEIDRSQYNVAFKPDGSMRRQIKCPRCNQQYIEEEIKR